MQALKSLISRGIWRFLILIFTGEKEHKIGSEKRQKHKKSKSEFFCRIEKNLENTGFSRVPLAERMGFEPMCDCSQTDFESSGENRTWRNLTEDNGRCENPEKALFSRLSAPLCIENTVKTESESLLRFRRVLTDFRESLLEFLIEPSVFSPRNHAFGSA